MLCAALCWLASKNSIRYCFQKILKIFDSFLQILKDSKTTQKIQKVQKDSTKAQLSVTKSVAREPKTIPSNEIDHAESSRPVKNKISQFWSKECSNVTKEKFADGAILI